MTSIALPVNENWFTAAWLITTIIHLLRLKIDALVVRWARTRVWILLDRRDLRSKLSPRPVWPLESDTTRALMRSSSLFQRWSHLRFFHLIAFASISCSWILALSFHTIMHAGCTSEDNGAHLFWLAPVSKNTPKNSRSKSKLWRPLKLDWKQKAADQFNVKISQREHFKLCFEHFFFFLHL